MHRLRLKVNVYAFDAVGACGLCIQLLNRNTKDLTPSFPEMVQAARVLPSGTLLDGDIVIADELGRSDSALSSVECRACAAAAVE